MNNNLITKSPNLRHKGFNDENIIILSNKKKDHLFSKNKIKEVCNNLDTKIVLSVNRLEFRKRVNLAVEGFSYYHKSYNSNSKLIIIGIGEDEKSLKKKVKPFNIFCFSMLF